LDDGEASKAFVRRRPGHFEPVDAAHIIEDHAEEGVPTVPNGLSLCKLHHAAFDRHFLGIRPDHRILIRPDLLGEKDGPTLLYSIQGLHDTELTAPRKKDLWPDRHRLEERWERFLKAAG
jgi:putative restriction endonuclease